MAGGVLTSRTLIVAPIEHVPLVNSTLALIDPSSTGDVLRVGLRRAGDTTNTVSHRWASWAMDDVDRQSMLRAFGQAKWVPRPTIAETTIYGPGQVPAVGQRMVLYDGLTVPADEVLRLLGLALLLTTEE